MPWWAWSLCAVWAGICSVWVFLLIAQLQVRRQGLLLQPRSPNPTDDETLPSVVVVIPACNEASQLASCLHAVLRQDYPAALSVLVVDDRSDDDTAAIAERFARSDSRLRVKRVSELPAGWMGKSHALWSATRDLTEEWLLFIDVDCTLDPEAVRTAVTEALRMDVQLLTLWPRIRAGSFWEHMTIPLCAGIIALWFGSKQTNDPNSPLALGMGAFLLINRKAYERIDGHRSVRNALIEDVPLVERAKNAGLRCRVASGRNIVSVRMYSTYRAIRDGWARIYVGALRSPMKITWSIAWLLLGSLLPYAALVGLLAIAPAVVVEGGGSQLGFLVPAVLCLTHLLLILIASYRFWGLGYCKRVYLWLYPVSVIVVIGILIRAWWWLTIRRRVSWRTTEYAIDRQGRILH